MIFKISNSDGRLRIAEIATLTDALGEAASQAYGRRTRRTVRFADGGEALEERRAYDKYGRLVAIAAFGTSVKWRYDARGRVARQVVDGSPIDFAYTKDGRLAGKWLGGRESPDASVEYEYSRDGRIAARTVNGIRQTYEYDARGRLLAVREDGADVERYAYDRAGNMVRKTVRGKTTTFTFDGANQLVSSTTGGVTTRYAYDAAGRLVREGAKTYRYGWLDKVLSVTDGARTYRYDWHADGQLARADYGDGTSESFLWDGLALVRRGGEDFVNEPHAGGGSPVASSKGAVYLNDLLGTMVGVREGRGPLRAKQGAKAPRYTAAALTAFGEPLPGQGAEGLASDAFFTGKPSVPGLGYAFLLRSYRPDLAKWQTADPLGYPDGWNRLAYCNNGVTDAVDLLGAYKYRIVISSLYDALNWYAYGCGEPASIADEVMLQFVESPGYRYIMGELEGELKLQPHNHSKGSFVLSDSKPWDQGFVLGRNTMNVFAWVNWEATGWTRDATGRQNRTLTGRVTMVFETSDTWDFEIHERDSLWKTLVAEVGPGVAANFYSFIFTGNSGTPFPLEGKTNDVKDWVYATQSRE